jgi:4-amino-4-deoxy-L-arabinose transferase-like glycosyltransferase
MEPSSTPISKHLLNLAILAILAGILLFVGLGSMGLTDRDEGRNAEAGREMFESGDWVSPTFNHEPRYAKPVLVYWLMSLSYSLFGVDEFSARLPSAAAGVVLILLQYLFLSRLRGEVVGLFGALMLLLNIETIGLSRMALTDSPLIFLTTLSLFSFWLGFQGNERERWWRWLFYIAMGLATLAKGPVGFLVPLLTIGLFLTLTRQWSRFWQQGSPLTGALLFAAIALPWYATMWSIHGADYAASAKANTVGRFLNPMEGHSFTIFFYVPVLFLGFFPWSGWLPFAWYDALQSWREARGKGSEARDQIAGEQSSSRHSPLASPPSASKELEWFAAAWVFGIFVFFTLSSTRLPHYIGPLIPAAAILTACYWQRGLNEPSTRGIRASIHTVMALGYLLAIGFAALPSLYPSFAGKLTKEFPLATQIDLGSGPYVASTLLLIGMALVGYFGLSESRRAGAFWAAGASLALLILVLIQLVVPGLNRYFISPPQVLAYAAGVNLGPTDQLIVYGSTRPSTVFYAKRHAIFVPKGEEATIQKALTQPGQTMVLLPETFQSMLPPEANKLVPILKQNGYILLANRPMVSIPENATPPPAKAIPGH